MKKSLALVAATIVVSSTAAFAASPTTPVYKLAPPYVKIAEGENGIPGGKSVVVDGTTVYSINQTQGRPTLEGTRNPELKITRSFDGGLTWSPSEVINTFTGDNNGDGYGLKVSNDPVFPGVKFVHTMWQQDNSAENGIFYRYFSTQTNTWSTKVNIAGPISNAMAYGNSFNVDSTGAVHGIFAGADPNWNWSLYYTKASSPNAGFSTPLLISNSVYTSDSTIDKQNNLLVTFTAENDNAYFMKKTGSNWSTPILASAGNGEGNWYASSITSFDASNIYIVHLTFTKLILAKSTNGGLSWTVKPIATAPANMRFSNYPAIVVNPTNKTLTVAAQVDGDFSNVYVYRSLDGITWAAPKIYPHLEHPSMAIDAAGKTYLTMGSENKHPTPSFFDTISADRAVYFTKE